MGLISGGDLKNRRPLDSLVGFRGKVLDVSCLITKRAFLRNDQSCKGKKIKKCNSLLKVKETISRKKVQLNKTIQGKQNTKKVFCLQGPLQDSSYTEKEYKTTLLLGHFNPLLPIESRCGCRTLISNTKLFPMKEVEKTFPVPFGHII